MFHESLAQLVAGEIAVRSICITLFCTWIFWRVGVATYNVCFHPLATYPGPWYRAAFWFPQDWAAFRGKSPVATKLLHDRYGDVVRLAPDVLSYNTAEAWKDIHRHSKGRGQIPKDPKRWAEPLNNILYCSDADHARMRKILDVTFSDHGVSAQRSMLLQYFDYLIMRLNEQLDDRGVGIVDMSKWYKFLTFDIIADLCLGAPLGALKEGQRSEHIETAHELILFHRWILSAKKYPWLYPWIILLTLFKPIAQNATRFLKFNEAAVMKRISEGQTSRNDLITSMLDLSAKANMSQQEMVETSNVIMFAGADTTATALTAATYYLLKNPQCYENLKREIRNHEKDDTDVTATRSDDHLPYLSAVIQEALRVHPPAAGTFARRTGPEGAFINGRFVPGNTSLGVNQWAAHYSADNFASPHTFAPERWLSNTPSAFSSDKRKAMQPFSYGPRDCVGQSLAKFELRHVLIKMLVNFDMELVAESEGWNDQKYYMDMIWESKPLAVKLTRRKQS